MNLHTRSICDACRENPATIQRGIVWLCELCDSSRVQFEIPSEFPSGVNASAAVASPPEVASPAAADASFSQSTLNSETRVDDGHWPATADPADPVAVSNSDPVSSFPPSPDTAAGAASCGLAAFSSFDPEIEPFVIAHEAVWARDRKKAVTLRATASRRIRASSASSVSIPST